MVKRLWALSTIACCIAAGQQGPGGLQVSVSGVTATQAILSYTAPDETPCSVSIREEGSANPVPDIDPQLFPGSNLDSRIPSISTGRYRVFVAGKRTAERASNGAMYSRALQAYTAHAYVVTCGEESATGSFITANIPLGSTYPELPAFDSSAFANQAWPTIDWASKSASYIDPLTGVLLRRLTGPSEGGPARLNNQKFPAALDLQGGWTNAENATSGSQSVLASTSSMAPLFLPIDVLVIDYTNNVSYVPGSGVDDLLEHAWGSGTDNNPLNRRFEVCLSMDSGQSCATNSIVLETPSSAGPVPSQGVFPKAPFGRWGGMALNRSLLAQPSGTVDVENSDVTLLSGGSFNPDWVAGTRIFVEGSAPACPQSHCTIDAVVSSSKLRIHETLQVRGARYRAASFGLRVKKTTAAGTLSLSFSYDLAASRMFLLPTNGANDLCSRVPVTTPVTADGAPLPSPQTGYLCVLPTATGPASLYFFIPETGEARLISSFYRPWTAPNPQDSFGGSVVVRPSSFDAEDGRVFYGTGSTGGPNYRTVLFKGRYTGDFRAWKSNYQNVPPPDGIEWQNLTPASQNLDIGAQLKSAQPRYDPKLFYYLTGIGVFSGQYIFQAASQQELPCFVAFFDVRTGRLTHSSDSWSTYPGRWGVCHTIQAVGHGNEIVASINAQRYPNPSAPLAGPFYVPLTHVYKNGVWSEDTSLTEHYADTCPADLDGKWQELGAAGSNCVRFRVSGEPCSWTPTADEIAAYPCPWDNQKSMLQTLEEGDVLTDFSANSSSERLRVVRKIVHAPNDIELVLQRKAFCTEGVPASYFRHAAGWRPSVAQPGGCHGAAWWISVTGDPPGWRLDDYTLVQSHFDIGTSSDRNMTTAVIGSYRVRQNETPFERKPFSTVINGYPTFGESRAAMEGITSLETYPSIRQWEAPSSERRWALDFRAYQAGTGVGPETPLNLYRIFTTPVAGTGSVYKISNPRSGFDRKRLPFIAWAGKNWLYDMSGPNSLIQDSDVFAFCVADEPGECRPDSAVNDAYVNVPSATLTQYCTSNQYLLNIPCFGTAQPVGASVVQVDVSRPDHTGLNTRRLTMAFSGPGRQYTYANARATPDGKWAFVTGYWLDGYRVDILAAKLPPWPGDNSANRSVFQPVKRRIERVEGAPNVRVRFGYVENGAVEDFYCTSRRETCVAGGNPYWFMREAPAAGLECSDGCEITIPVIPGRIVYYQVERLKEDGTSYATEPVSVFAVP